MFVSNINRADVLKYKCIKAIKIHTRASHWEKSMFQPGQFYKTTKLKLFVVCFKLMNATPNIFQKV